VPKGGIVILLCHIGSVCYSSLFCMHFNQQMAEFVKVSVTQWLMQRTVTNSVCFDTVSVMLVLCRSEISEIPAFFTVYRYRNKLLSEEIVVSFLFTRSALASEVKCFVLPCSSECS